jgi:hypothetical protein
MARKTKRRIPARSNTRQKDFPIIGKFLRKAKERNPVSSATVGRLNQSNNRPSLRITPIPLGRVERQKSRGLNEPAGLGVLLSLTSKPMSTFTLILLGWILASFLLGPLCLLVVSEPAAPDDANDRATALDPRARGLAA